MSTIIHPDYIRIVERKPGGWLFRGKLFQKCIPVEYVDFDDFELMYGISKQQVGIELFRLNGGKAGYYLADLRHKRYYYCGPQWNDVKAVLSQLGIGRDDPTES